MAQSVFTPQPQQNRRIVITGTGGIGLEAARMLVRAGADIVIAGRNPEHGHTAVTSIQMQLPQARVRFEVLDLARLASVADFCARMNAGGEPVDVLINNAGVMQPPKRQTTADGYELQFGVNYLGHFALTAGLLPLLRKGTAPRVVNVTSLAQKFGKIDFDNLQSDHPYNAGMQYSVSKLLVAIFALELQRRSDAGGWGITSLAAHPGIAATNLFLAQQGANSLQAIISERIVIPLLGQSAEGGALPLVYAATAPDAVGGGLYGPRGFMEMKGPPGRCQYAKAAFDEKTAARLWKISEEMTGLKFGNIV